MRWRDSAGNAQALCLCLTDQVKAACGGDLPEMHMRAAFFRQHEVAGDGECFGNAWRA